MQFDFLKSLKENYTDFVSELNPHQLGSKVLFYDNDSDLNWANFQIAIVGVAESRGAKIQNKIDLSLVRGELYKLYTGNWDCSIVDLGDLILGESLNDTYFALNFLTRELVKKNIVLVILGGGNDLVYPLYRAFDKLDKMVNLVSVDSKFDFGNSDEVSADSYLAKIIMDEPNNLHNYSNLGYQTYFNSQEEIDLMERLFFDSYRLGEVSADISIAEPVLRDADIVSIDLTSIQSSFTGNFSEFVPNGFTGKEICSISRYAGLSDRISVFGLFNSEGSLRSEAVLQAQIIWYFIEGYVCRYNEYPFKVTDDTVKYIVSFDDDLSGDMDLVFYRSELSQRWWMEVPFDLDQRNKLYNSTLLPCGMQEYQEAMRGVFPERWWKEYKKNHSVQ